MRLRRAMVEMMLARQMSVVIMAISLVALGRLLPPEAFGIFAALSAAVAVVEMVTKFGITQRLTRLPEITDADLRAGQGLALALGLGGGALVVGAAALPWGAWPEDTRAALVLLGLALPALAVSSTIEVAYARGLQMSVIARVSVARQLVDSATAIGLATLGAGVVALAAGLLAQHVLGALLMAWVARSGPRFRPSHLGWRPFCAFARDWIGIGAAGRIGDAGVAAAISGALGFESMGLFNRAKRVTGLLDDTLLTGLMPVVLPALTRALDAGRDRTRVYLAKVDCLAALCWPAFAVIALMADDLVLLLLGTQWGDAVMPVRFLALAGLALPIGKMSMEMFIAIDATGAYARIQTVHQVARLALVGAGSLHSLEGACLGAATSSYVKAMMISVSLKSRVDYTGGDLGVIAGRAAVLTGGALLLPLATLWLMPDGAAPLRLALALAGATLGWLVAAALVRHTLLTEMLDAVGAATLARRLRKRRTAS